MVNHDRRICRDLYGLVFCGLCAVHTRLRTVEVTTMTVETAIVLVLSILLMGYLVYALLRPEKF